MMVVLTLIDNLSNNILMLHVNLIALFGQDDIFGFVNELVSLSNMQNDLVSILQCRIFSFNNDEFHVRIVLLICQL